MKRLQKSPAIRFPLTRILGVMFLAGLVATANAQTTYIKADNTNFLNTAASYTANIPNSSAVTTTNIFLNKTNPSVFYRLIHQP